MLPSSILSLWDGNPLTTGPEQMVEGRGITKSVGYAYGLGWDYDRQAIFIPWIDHERKIRVYQHWDGAKYRFPHDEPGRMTKGDAIFGLHTWKPGRPLVLAEGCFTAMSVCGCALGGSSTTDAQVAILKVVRPETIIVAFDNDDGGFHGADGVTKRLATEVGCRVIPVFCPHGNDWNEYLKVRGFKATMEAFAERIQNSMALSPTMAIATQYRGGR